MRKVLITLAAAGTALAFATPAAAQYYPQPQPYGYGSQPYAYGGQNGYGFNAYGQARMLQARIDAAERRINRVRGNRAERLRNEAHRLEQRLRFASRDGLNPYEMNDLSQRVAGFEQRVRYATAYGYGRGYNGSNGGYNGHDRDGDDSRWDGNREHDDRDDD